MDLVIRRARHGDEAALARLNGMVQALHVGARPDIFVPVSEGELAAWFRGVLDSPTQAVWLAEVAGRAAGYLLAEILERPATPFGAAQRWCEIDQLGVDEGMRGRGIARALVDAAVAWAGELGITRASAQCWAFNRAAQDTFARLGFSPMIVRLERPPGAR